MLRRYFQDYESEEDEDYNPTKQEEALYRQEHDRKKRNRQAAMSAKELFQDMQAEYQHQEARRRTPVDVPNTLELAERIINSDQMRPNKRVVFAGKEFILNEETGQLEIVEKKVSFEQVEPQHPEEHPEDYEKRKTHIAYQYLNHVMRAIYNRSRKINSVGKSKLDWKGFVKQEGIEDKLKYNRKGGVIGNMHFIQKTA